jgi:hypothetical protein
MGQAVFPSVQQYFSYGLCIGNARNGLIQLAVDIFLLFLNNLQS